MDDVVRAQAADFEAGRSVDQGEDPEQVVLWGEAKIRSKQTNHLPKLFAWLWKFPLIILNCCPIYRQHTVHCFGRFLGAPCNLDLI